MTPRIATYSEFSSRLHRRSLEERVPLCGSIELTRRCPLRCVQCYNNEPLDDREAREAELGTGELCSILDQVADAGCLWLLLTGGEIFAREDFFGIYRHARELGFLVSLFTNGTLITPEIADALAESRPFSIEISLYGRTRETYERIAGVPGSFDRCLRGISLLRERGLPLKLKTMVLTINRSELEDMKRFAGDLGLDFSFDCSINPRIDRSRRPLAYRLEPREVVELDLGDPRRAAEWHRVGEELGGAPSAGDEVYRCGGGISSFAIDPEGMLSLCVLSRQETYDLRAGSFREGWEDFLRRIRSRKAGRPTRCAACSLRGLCGMCPANGELERGDPDSPVDFYCQVAHARARALGMLPGPRGGCERCDPGDRGSASPVEGGIAR